MEVLINSTISITIMSVVILVMRWVFKDRLPAKIIYTFWLFLLLCLLTPLLPSSPFSAYNHIFTIDLKEESVYRLPEVEAGTSIATEIGYAKHKYVFGDEKYEYLLVRHTDEAVIYKWWLGVAGLLFVYFNLGLLLYQHKLRHYKECLDQNILILFENTVKKVGVKKKIRLFCHEGAPMTFGFIRPVIMIPDTYTLEELEYVLLHELFHIKHRNFVIDYIGMIFVCLNWFHPIVWYCFKQLKKDEESYCDEAVLRVLNHKKEYAQVLLKTAICNTRFRPKFMVTYIGKGRKEVKKRIVRIANKRTLCRKWLISFGLICGFVVVLFMTKGVKARDSSSDRGMIPDYFRNMMEQCILHSDKSIVNTDVLYLCEDEEYIYVYSANCYKDRVKDVAYIFNIEPNEKDEKVKDAWRAVIHAEEINGDISGLKGEYVEFDGRLLLYGRVVKDTPDTIKVITNGHNYFISPDKGEEAFIIRLR